MSVTVELNEAAGVCLRLRITAYAELAKPRIAVMVLLATVLGFYLALPPLAGSAGLGLLFHTLMGTALVAAGANALNQFAEAKRDAMMVRTAGRPLPSQRLTPKQVLTFAVVASVGGVLYLSLCVNLLASLIAALALVGYIFLYTPLKRITWLCVLVGAVPGAAPPLIGWAAGAGTLTWVAVIPFVILFFWQLPHFGAIAWLHREDYGRAGFPALSVIDPQGTWTARYVIASTLALIGASLLPALCGLTGVVYGIGAVALGVSFLGWGMLFAYRKTKEAARFHLLASVIYLPSLFAAMMLDKAAQL